MQFNGFRPVRSEHGTNLPEIQRWILGESITYEEGEAVKVVPGASTDGGYIDLADAVADNVYGFIVGFETSKGLPLAKAVSGTDYDGTLTESPSGDSYATSADNLTDKKVQALIIPAKGLVISALLDAAKGTTAGSY